MRVTVGRIIDDWPLRRLNRHLYCRARDQCQLRHHGGVGVTVSTPDSQRPLGHVLPRSAPRALIPMLRGEGACGCLTRWVSLFLRVVGVVSDKRVAECRGHVLRGKVLRASRR